MKSLYQQSKEIKWNWDNWLLDEEGEQRLRENKNVKITCKRCGKTIWRTQWRMHIRSVTHQVNKYNEIKSKKISGIVNFN
tara:strand:+ start:204 stop:443 length:240 start_codon:yes stop_codon:yes gene_type:complete